MALDDLFDELEEPRKKKGRSARMGDDLDDDQEQEFRGTRRRREVAEKFCHSCGADVPSHSKYCPECGEQLDHSSTCSYCGADVSPGARFCSSCGAKVS